MLNVEMTKTPDESGVQLKLSWKPEAETIQFTAEELVKQNYGNSLAMLMSNALTDLSIVVQGFKDFIEKRLGEKSAEMFEEAVTSNPKLLFEVIPSTDTEMKKEDIRNADFY